MKIAFVCDWLTGMRGGERCLEAMCEVYPQADIFTLVYYPENFNGEFSNHKITTSFIQRLPGNDKTFRRYLPFFPNAIESFDFTGYDLVLSFSSCVAKSVILPSGTPHICYCHSPVRYAWDMRADYVASMPKLKRLLTNFILDRLQKWDLKTSNRPTSYIANSKFIRERINNCYGLDSTVIYPPVDCSRFSVCEDNDDYYLVLSALTPYKRIDLAVEAFSTMKKKLVVIGKGSELEKLKAMADNNIEFIDNANDEEVSKYLTKSKALIFPGKEDFGIVPLEAQACGKPVIAFGEGGALETVNGLNKVSDNIDCGNPASQSPTGIFFEEQTPQSLIATVEKFEDNQSLFLPQACAANAQRFNRDRYKREMREFIDNIT